MTDAISRWCILRTSGGQTLRLAHSLRDAGYDAWSPARTIRKLVRRGTRNEQRLEVDVPILPTFVFARDRDLVALADEAIQTISPHPAFSIFRHGGRIPLISNGSVAGLREEEARAAATIQAMRDAETFQEAERIRVAAIKSEAARRRAEKELEHARRTALRAQGCTLEPGTDVRVIEMPAMVGLTGVFESANGAFSTVRFGSQSWKIESWQVSPAGSDD